MKTVIRSRNTAYYFRHINNFGTWALVPTRSRHWEIWHDGYAVERHNTLPVAFNELITGGCYWPDGLDPSECGLPEELGEWERVPIMHR